MSPVGVLYESSPSAIVTGPGQKGVVNLTVVSPDLAISAGSTLHGNISFVVNATNQVCFHPLLPLSLR